MVEASIKTLDVVIVGCGAAGIAAGRTISEHKELSYVILEAD
jgi:cation diffusion facilitator CzcD-associated flavoprotein CzcO